MKLKLKKLVIIVSKKNLALAFSLSFIILSVNVQLFAQEITVQQKQEIDQVIELKLPDNKDFFNIADEEKEDSGKEERQSPFLGRIIDLPSFEQATINNYTMRIILT
jgi:hypothetical protein